MSKLETRTVVEIKQGECVCRVIVGHKKDGTIEMIRQPRSLAMHEHGTTIGPYMQTSDARDLIAVLQSALDYMKHGSDVQIVKADDNK